MIQKENKKEYGTKSFKRLASLFKDYNSFEKQLSKEYNEIAGTGKYSKVFLADLADNHRKQLAAERTSLNKRIQETRAEFKKAMENRNNIVRCQPNPFLTNFLAALPDDVTESEFVEIMQAKGTDALSKRMIANAAQKHGFKMSPGPSTEEALQKFDQMSDFINKSLSGTAVLRAFMNPEEAMETALRFTAEVDDPKISCVKDIKVTDWKTAAQSIEEDMKRNTEPPQSLTEAEKEAFRKNLTNADPECLKDLRDAEKGNNQYGLTSEEMRTAQILAFYNNKEGVITPEIIDYVKSERPGMRDDELEADAAEGDNGDQEKTGGK